MGVDVRGKSSMLKVNYRTSHQIRSHADRLLDREIADVDGNVEDRRGTISLFDGAVPEIINVGPRRGASHCGSLAQASHRRRNISRTRWWCSFALLRSCPCGKGCRVGRAAVQDVWTPTWK